MTNDNQLITIESEPDETSLAKVVQNHSLITNETIFTIQLMAPIYHQCRLYGYTNEMQAAAVMLKAAGMGIPPTSAPDFFDYFEGKISLKTIGANALIQRSGIIKVEIKDGPDFCKVRMTRLDNGFSHEVTYTAQEAKQSNLIKPGKDNSAWNRYPTDMLYNAAFRRCARRVAPDIIGGIPLTAELEELRERNSQLPAPDDGDQFAAIAGDTHCPTCGERL